MPSSTPAPSLIEYPCAFPIKVVGENVPGFEDSVVALVMQVDAAFDVTTVTRRYSSQSNWLALTITPMLPSQEATDTLYRALTSHPLVKFAL